MYFHFSESDPNIWSVDYRVTSVLENLKLRHARSCGLCKCGMEGEGYIYMRESGGWGQWDVFWEDQR